jgi:hypothetical protein
MERKEFHPFVGDGMHKVSVGPKVTIMGVVIVEEIILWTSVVRLITSLVCPTSWPTHNNKRETT